MVLELIGGPLDGVIHELHKGFPPPDRFGLTNEDGNERYWYLSAADKRTAIFVCTEQLTEVLGG